jgi:integrase
VAPDSTRCETCRTAPPGHVGPPPFLPFNGGAAKLIDRFSWVRSDAFVYSMLGGRFGVRGDSPATVTKVHRVPSLILDMAVNDGRLARNVAKGVNLPRIHKAEHLYLTHEQVEDLANECGYPNNPSKFSSHDIRTNETYRLVVLFLAYTGMRFGEMAALQGPDSTCAASALSSPSR